MDDTISRRMAIDAVEFGITYAKAIDVNTGESKELFKEGNDALKKAVERLKELPSAEPERKKGKWQWCGNHHLCSECDEWALTRWNEDECDEVDILTDFCPNCGADMRGDKDEDR